VEFISVRWAISRNPVTPESEKGLHLPGNSVPRPPPFIFLYYFFVMDGGEVMPPPYKSTRDLPDPIQNALPAPAQEIFLKAVNAAWEQYKEPRERRDPRDTREAVAFKVAWAAVEKGYQKDPKSGRWKKKS
jgi:cation transport regulator